MRKRKGFELGMIGALSLFIISSILIVTCHKVPINNIDYITSAYGFLVEKICKFAYVDREYLKAFLANEFSVR